jgi:hypothetical protein
MDNQMNTFNQLPRIIALCGKKRVGKDTVANYICEKYGYKNVKFAEPLKGAVQALFGFTHDQIEHDKETIDPTWEVTPRQVMQYVGCEFVQKKMDDIIPGIGRTFFVKSLLKKYQTEKIVISDMRFIHEYEGIKNENPDNLVIKILRSEIDDGDQHISEKELESIQADIVINNDKSTTDLFRHIDSIITSYNKNK